MRKLALLTILAVSVSISQAAPDMVAWSGPHSLRMERAAQVIDSHLASRIASLKTDETLPLFVFFTDKGINTQSEYTAALIQAESHLTPAARERRMKSRGQDELVDFTDLPVYSPYVEQVLSTGATLRQTLKWFNAVSVNATGEQALAISRLPFARLMRLISGFPANIDIPASPSGPGEELLTTLNYGPSAGQLNQINVISAHELGFKGQGVIICMMDVGYKQAHIAFQNIINSGRLLAQYDFINHDDNTDFDPDQDPPGQADHGTLTWSTLGGEASGHIYGPSYLADFILAKTEDVSSERHIEEDNWAAGAEWADSLGASVISSSLGYRYFDFGQGDYDYEDFDGHTIPVTLAALQAARNGIAVCNAMGNEGNITGSLIAPSDADSILSCGAVNSAGDLANFSSFGPTYDGRTKPEVCAQGVNTVCADPYDMNGFYTAGGTSLSTPLVGGSSGILFSAHPNWNCQMVREALMMTATKTDSISSAFGWGIMDVGRALYYHPQGDILFNYRPIMTARANSPINLNMGINGGFGVQSSYLYWRNGQEGDFTEVPMTGDTLNFAAQIPGQSGSLVQYYIKAVDADSSYAYDPVGGPEHPFSVGLGATQFTDDLENGPIYWKSGGTKNSWGLTPKYAQSGNLSITDSPTESYKNNTDSWLESAFAIDLSQVTDANFSFYWRGVLQSGHDSLHIEISTDNGNSWNRLPVSLNGSIFSFTQRSADLAAYVGNSNVKIRFHFVSDGTGRYEGVYLDDISLTWTPTGIDDGPDVTPISFSLGQNYPNPFNPSTRISFSLPRREEVHLNVFDILGRHVKTLASGELAAGEHNVIWDGTDESGRDVASGIYLYKLDTPGASDARRMTLLR
jgi:hypothetical protein